ncbi:MULTISPECIES: MATE family efflux transporter [Methanoculleus]|uniref:Multidrug-efflux transporter n=2 Tax=Methanoculleus TaxID=45989 RepID=A3CVV8_METMJ|nr:MULTISPECIES: MATE family efflux transporter [Methanoculleus]ABN57508.1 MATE efflux family protein [Methanoculleus marisnigri JR1]MCC7554857.1 MATE family efflux transporter [Methanoculleus marisnigri]UYU18912.1 MATE family efflux transporter [Methanoculleus submarinus]
MSELTEGDLFRGLITIAAPIVAGNVLQSGLELVDLFFVGRLGSEAIAGVAMSTSIVMVLMTIIIGIVTANTAFVSRYYGAKNYDMVAKGVSHTLILGLVFSILLSVVGILYAEDMLLLLGAEPNVALLGASYLTVLFTGSVTLVELWVINSSFQSCGDATTPMLLVVLANILNIALDPLLIFGYGVVPACGVAGAAYATIISRSVAFAIAFALLLSGRSPIPFSFRTKFEFSLAWRLIRVAVPNSVQSGLRSVTFLAMMAIVAVFGTAALSAYGIVGRLELVALMPGFGIATATAVIVGQNLGAKKPERAEAGVRLSALMNSGFMALMGAIFYLAAPAIVEVFDPSGASTEIGVSYMQTVAPFYVFLAVAIILGFALNGAGDTKKPMYATLFSMVLFQVPLACILPGLLGIGIAGVWLAVICGMILQMGMLFAMYRHGGWKSTVI